mmetsp:Transcript_26635/g.85426  ORF Transcript_26635/g.85426 Transcript_26635/m.85426 type:complete len:212 (-) Transcript_26635:554-1189(-)
MSLEVSDFRPRSLHNLQLRELAGASGGREPLGDLVEEEGDGTPGCDGEHASRRPRKEGARTFGAVQVRRDRRRTAPLSDRRLQPRLDEVRRRGEQRRGSGGGAGARGRGRGRKLRLVGDARVTRNEVAPVPIRRKRAEGPSPPDSLFHRCGRTRTRGSRPRSTATTWRCWPSTRASALPRPRRARRSAARRVPRRTGSPASPPGSEPAAAP